MTRPSAGPAKPEARVERIGPCGGVTSRGKCHCSEFVKGREIAGLLTCAREACSHSQGVHARVEVSAA